MNLKQQRFMLEVHLFIKSTRDFFDDGIIVFKYQRDISSIFCAIYYVIVTGMIYF